MQGNKRQTCEQRRSVDVVTKGMSKYRDKRGMAANQALCFFFSFLQTSTVKAFDVIIHTQAVSLAETLFKSTGRNAPLMDSANVSICINGLLLTPTKPSIEPAMGLSCQAKNWAVNICVECGGRPMIFWHDFCRLCSGKQNFAAKFGLPTRTPWQIHGNIILITRFFFSLTSEHAEPGRGRYLARRVGCVALVYSFISRGSQWLDPQDRTGPIVKLDHLVEGQGR